MKSKSLKHILMHIGLLASLCLATLAYSHSASTVWFEFRQDGKYRVHFTYTVPAFREVRGGYVDFYKKKSAEKFYWQLVRGGDFHIPNPNPNHTHFHPTPQGPSPW